MKIMGNRVQIASDIHIAKPATEVVSTTPGDLARCGDAPSLGYGKKSINNGMAPRDNVETGCELQEEESELLGYQGCQHKGPGCQPITVFWEVEQGETQVSDEQGRLRKCLGFWEETLNPPLWIISCISEGYTLLLQADIAGLISSLLQTTKSLYLNLFRSYRETVA